MAKTSHKKCDKKYGEGSLNKAFSEVRTSSLWGLTIPDKDDKICSEYGNYTIHMHAYLFSIWGVYLPFIAFEVDVFNYLMMAPPQLRP